MSSDNTWSAIFRFWAAKSASHWSSSAHAICIESVSWRPGRGCTYETRGELGISYAVGKTFGLYGIELLGQARSQIIYRAKTALIKTIAIIHGLL